VERRFASVAGRCALAVLAAAAAFALVEPFAIMNFPRFMHDFIEQSTMVRNAGVYPYTTQYMHTAKYGYDIEQLVVWCMAPPLGLTAVWATVTRLGTAMADAPHRRVGVVVVGHPVLSGHRLVRGEISTVPAADLSVDDLVGGRVAGAEVSQRHSFRARSAAGRGGRHSGGPRCRSCPFIPSSTRW